MARILFVLVLALALYFLWRVLQANKAKRSGASSPKSTPRAALAMVSCASCGLHLPRPDALTEGDRFYCSEEHRVRGPAEG